MRVTAMLSWYDEPLELLREGVASLRGFCDRIVALDGAYEFTPGASRLSPPEQAAMIKQVAHDSGFHDVTIAWPERVWAGQIEKRQHLLDLAADPDYASGHDGASTEGLDTAADRERDGLRRVPSVQGTAGAQDHGDAAGEREPDVREDLREALPERSSSVASPADWLLVHDADHLVEGDPAGFHEFLAALPDDVVTVEALYRTPAVEGKHLTPWHDWLTQETFYTPLLFRNLPEMRVERHHWWYSGLLGDERVAMHGWDDSGGDLEGAGDLPIGRHVVTNTFQVTHRCFDRPEETLERQRGLYAARDVLVAATGIEP